MVAPVVLISRPRLTQLRAGASGEWTELTDEASGNGSVSYADGFGLMRPSNTTPVIVLRFEADNAVALQRIQDCFSAVILAAAPEVKLPF